jgi:hypothetical protein
MSRLSPFQCEQKGDRELATPAQAEAKMTQKTQDPSRSFTDFSSAAEEAREHRDETNLDGHTQSGRSGGGGTPDELTELERRELARERISQSRAYATNEERTVLALEAIADQLQLLVALVTPEDEDSDEFPISQARMLRRGRMKN